MAGIQLQQHGIQLNYVGVRELSFKSTKHPSTIKSTDDDGRFTTGRSELSQENTISVMVRFESDAQDGAYNLKVELIAEFRVNPEVFPIEKADEWAEKAAPFVLMPFLREHVFSLSARVELPPILLPLLLVPTFKVAQPELSAEASTGSI